MKSCEICGKGSKMVGHRIKLRGHYNPTNWTRKYPNLQRTLTPAGLRALACVQCIKTFAKADRPTKARILKQVAPAKVEAPKVPAAEKPKEAKQPTKKAAKEAPSKKVDERKRGNTEQSTANVKTAKKESK